MNIKFSNNNREYTIERDTYQYTLSKILTVRKGRSKGETRKSVIGHYPKEQELISALIRYEVGQSAINTTLQLADFMSMISKELSYQLRKL